MPREEVHNGATAVGVKGVLHILGSAALGTVAGHKEERMGQLGAQRFDLLGIGGTGDRAHAVVAVLAHKIAGPLLGQLTHDFIRYASRRTSDPADRRRTC